MVEILEDNVAEITIWQNNCAVSCVAVFLINSFLDKNLTLDGLERLQKLFNSYYGTYLSMAELDNIFTTVFVLPSDRQAVLGPVLRDFIIKSGVKAEEENILSNEAFVPLVEAFGFNVVFYVDHNGKIEESDKISSVIRSKNNLTLKTYCHEKHYDLIMDDSVKAMLHNNSSFEISIHELPTAAEEEKQLKARVRKITDDPLQTSILEGYLDELRSLGKQEDDSTALELADALDESLETFQERNREFLKKNKEIPKEQQFQLIQEFRSVMMNNLQGTQARLSNNATFNQVLKNIILFVVTVGVGYLAMPTYNRINDGNFFSFQPK